MKFLYLLYLVIARLVIDIISTPDDLLTWVTLFFASCAVWWVRKKESKKDD
ncbi:hypothetical protein SAMN05216582_12839 [Selenomonas ruminantium]|jgi:hypothetical protein|uniref:Uncharacterized protein n=1 Tax=Selenomonas ruminantium TaxID=971 RepID=A0A1M6WV45_SELRU|nr:hypothetical protein SAMN05216582_12839 [Selenomonas ruminantium]